MTTNKILIEYACYDEILSKNVRANVFKALDLGVKSISVPMVHMSAISTIVPEGIVLSCPIDWPDGRSSIEMRIHEATKVVYQGATAFDLVASAFLFRNGKEENFVNDLKAILSLANAKKVTLRVMLDHRKIENSKQFQEVLKLIKSSGDEFVFCATGQYSDDPIDNIVLCALAQKDFELNAIANASIYLPQHFQTACSSGLFGVRFHNIKALETCLLGV